MDALEREIDLEAYNFDGYAFKSGASFILEKNLDEQFADFLHLLGAVPANEKGKWDIVDKDFNMYTKTTKELKSYWLNNVYGK